MAILDDLRRERGLALLFITHDLDLADAVCDRMCVMYAGQIVEDQASAALAQAPLHPYTLPVGRRGPRSTGPVQRLAAIRGRPLSAFEAPAGCAFAPRCDYAQERCTATGAGYSRTIDGAMVQVPAGAASCGRVADPRPGRR